MHTLGRVRIVGNFMLRVTASIDDVNGFYTDDFDGIKRLSALCE